MCSLLFSKNVNEIVSTHGYSMNQIIIWNYPSMERIAVLTGIDLTGSMIILEIVSGILVMETFSVIVEIV